MEGEKLQRLSVGRKRPEKLGQHVLHELNHPVPRSHAKDPRIHDGVFVLAASRCPPWVNSSSFLHMTHNFYKLAVLRDLNLKDDATAARRHAKKMTRSLARLAQDMWKSNNNHGVADPSGFRNAVCGFAPKFAGFEQHDSQEFLLYALDGLHIELNRVEKKVIVVQAFQIPCDNE